MSGNDRFTRLIGLGALVRVGLVCGLLLPAGGSYAQPADLEPPLFEGHIHYNSDVWQAIDPAGAIDRLRSAGIERAFVSSTPTRGTEQLYQIDPDRIVPLLRPYRNPGDRVTWFADPEVLAHVRERLAAFPYRGIGEFHVFGADASTPQMAELIELARARSLFLHAHADTDAIVRILDRAPEIPVIWAHAGFDVSLETLERLLGQYPQLYLELSFRRDVAPLGQLSEAWRRVLVERRGRFLVGLDTYIPSRWAELDQLAQEARVWLRQLPPEVARAVAYENAQRLLDGLQGKRGE